ncbi:Putative methylesterase 12, chloroplastic [Linum perenne]
MGNLICKAKKSNRNLHGSRRNGRKKLLADEELIHRQALSMALHQHQLSQRFDGSSSSMSRRIGSTSSRRKNLADVKHQFQDKIPENLDNVKIKTFVLVHGEGFGAWCWYKTIAYLEEVGLVPVALDLTGSGIDTTDSNCIMTLADYSKPLISYLEQLPDDEKVILVGHSTGGASVSYALELFPEKISKAIFVCATMVSDGQRPFDAFAAELGSAELFMKESQFLIHGNGKNNPPTGFMFEKQLMKSLYFNQSPTKDVALAMVSMRPAPICPTMEKLSLTAEKYGTSRRFFVQTLEDRALSADVQEKLVRENPPEGVYNIKGSDHCPFFSKPQSLHKILVEIAQIE